MRTPDLVCLFLLDENRAFDYNLNPVPMHYVVLENPEITYGGQWQPTDSHSDPLAIIIPFRNRHKHLSVLLRNLIVFLQVQRKAFHFYVIEQVRVTLFGLLTIFIWSKFTNLLLSFNENKILKSFHFSSEVLL